ncbi:transcriptional regulator [Natrinema saccharevitans]|uniref:Transcriptional regulator n=1 Tax=Natrinema saccharevitans TaxID=301967 RepID=A0A1S8AXR7_9EURY|nr:transcriptional regulator [Natrinema saccharevitans]OLZ41452.1 transcriptional regulator [Natrinema saccharevitans]
MDPRTQERVEEWDSRPFSGGFDGLSDLAAADFSGAVSGHGTWLFMLNGRIVGVVDGDIDDFETASGTRYEAPHPSLPLLCAMEERGGDTRAKYYTNETPLREVDNTLQSGSFTGYVELSENVLSGDYYAVYYGGRRMAAAYIGNAERLLTGEEAFERAADEVGIYEVIDVEIDVTDVPVDDEPASASATDSAADSSPAADTEPASGTGAAGGHSEIGADPAPETTASADDGPATDSTDSSIEPIDVSGSDSTEADPIEDVTADDPESIEGVADDASSLSSEIDLAEDPSGITATDEVDTEPEPTGITDAESAIDTDPSGGRVSDTDAIAGTGSVTESVTEEVDRQDPADTGSTSQPDVDRQTTESTAPTITESEDGADDDPTGTEPAVAAGAAEPADDASDSSGTTGSETDRPDDPDLAEVEAAAEELERNGISWVDESDDEDPTADDAETPDGDLEEELEREEQWRETRRIPSIDPDNSESEAESDGRSRSGDRSATAAGSRSSDGRGDSSAAQPASTTAKATATGASRDARDRAAGGGDADASGRSAETDAASERVAALTEKLETLQERYEALETTAEELEAERDRLRSENDELSSTVERLQSRIESLEAELERAREADSETADAGASTQLSVQRALAGTNLFVRYASKSQPTLETAHDGDADRSEVASNLQLEHHTQFESADAAVDGRPYDEFLAASMEYRFVDWLTATLLYEIRDTGNADGLGDLYDAIPRIDRAELGATISLADDDTEDVPDEVTFDIVAFDKMGNPLVLVALNDSREPATQDTLEELEAAASAVKANYPDLAAAIAVTSSYFEPGALEVAEQATSGGLLSRGSKLSYVNLSRKTGYHLCLVESRSEGFHMNVPEL